MSAWDTLLGDVSEGDGDEEGASNPELGVADVAMPQVAGEVACEAVGGGAAWDALLDVSSEEDADSLVGPVPNPAGHEDADVGALSPEVGADSPPDEPLAIVPVGHGAHVDAIVERLPPPPSLTTAWHMLRRRSANCADLPVAMEGVANVLLLDPGKKRVPVPNPQTSALLEHLGRTKAHMSLTSLGQDHKMSTAMVRNHVQRYYAAIFHSMRQASRRMLSSLVAGVQAAGGECLVFSEFASYDETPLSLKVRALEDFSDLVRGPREPAEGAAAMVEVSKNKDSAAKIVQSECVISVLFRLGDRYQEVHFEVPVSLSVVDRCTGETYTAVQEAARPPLEDVASCFRRTDRHAMTDGDTAVSRAERAMAQRGPQRLVNHGVCRVHKISSLATRGIDALVSDDVSSLIRIALALQPAPAMKLFRRCLRETLAQRLVILRGAPSVAAEQHRLAVLDAFCPIVQGDRSSIVRRTIVQCWANGNYMNKERFEVYLNGPYERSEVLHSLCTDFVHAVAGRPPGVYPRHRWTGASRTLQRIGLLLNMHGLFQEAFRLFAQRQNVSQPQAAGAEVAAILDQGGVDGEQGRQDPVAEDMFARVCFLHAALGWMSLVNPWLPRGGGVHFGGGLHLSSCPPMSRWGRSGVPPSFRVFPDPLAVPG